MLNILTNLFGETGPSTIIMLVVMIGIFYFLLNIGSGLAAIWFAWRNRGEKFALMPLMITLGFGVLSMLGSCNVSFWYMTTLYYYLVQFPIIASCSAGEGRNLKAPEVADVECTHD